MANYFNNPYSWQNYAPYPTQQPVQQQPTIQQGGYVTVSSEKEALDYPVAQATSVTFIDWKNQKLYVKTRGFSPLEAPSFERHTIVKDTDSETEAEATPVIEYAEKSDVEALRSEIERINNMLNKEAKDNA